MKKIRPLHAAHAQHKPYRGRFLRTLTAITGTILVSTLTIGAVYVYSTEQTLKDNSVEINTVVAEPELPKNTDPHQTPPEMLTGTEGPITLLLVGNDDGGGKEQWGNRDHALNDVNMLIHVSADHRTATAISFPRDMYTEIPECTNPETGNTKPATYDKINAGLNHGGFNCVAQTITNITGQPINNAIMVGFDGVIALSNAVGGVPVCLTEPIRDRHTNLNLEAGDHTLQGEQALGFLRTRYGVGDGSDLGRISNQQVFLSSLIRTIKSEKTLTDPIKLLNIAEAVTQNTTLSSNLASIPTLTKMAYSLKDLQLENVTFVQAPTKYADNGVVLLEEPAQQLFNAVFSDQNIALTGDTAPGNIGSVKTEAPAVPEEPETYNKVEEIPEGDMGIPINPSERAHWTEKYITGIPTIIPPEAVDTTPAATTVELPSNITGQKATDYTCSSGYRG